MKKILNIGVCISAIVLLGLSSCSKMLEAEGTHDLFDKELTEKTDSMFMAYGIMQCLQQLADQYVVIGEMCGDLADTTAYSSEHLRRLYDFSAGTENKYDSAYTYYAVVNNCNYYIAHRNPEIYTGSTNVAINEYAAVHAIRAWAYLMLARIYGTVPFFTEPLTTISQIDDNSYPKYNIRQIVDQLAPDLVKYSGLAVPNYGQIDCGSTNFGQSKTAQSRLCFIPVDVILGEMYLETEQYEQAALYYTKYIVNNKIGTGNRIADFSQQWTNVERPHNFYSVSGNQWSSFFGRNATDDIISYIPMSVNRIKGTITRVPQLFGYNYYSTSSSADSLYTDDIEIAPSAAYMTLADSAWYYYPIDQVASSIDSVKMGDMRRASTFQKRNHDADTTLQMRKYNYANVILYRNTTVYLHLAEALNRMGYYDIAFAILKDGVDRNLLSKTYLRPASLEFLQQAGNLLSAENITIFDAEKGNSKVNFGIHKHGCGYTNGKAYVIESEVARYNPVAQTPADSISAMEEILCDEYAMEFAFEGTRYFDLMRLARHKNNAQSGTGNQWLANKLAFKNPQKNLTDENNWYLPLH